MLAGDVGKPVPHVHHLALLCTLRLGLIHLILPALGVHVVAARESWIDRTIVIVTVGTSEWVPVETALSHYILWVIHILSVAEEKFEVTLNVRMPSIFRERGRGVGSWGCNDFACGMYGMWMCDTRVPRLRMSYDRVGGRA